MLVSLGDKLQPDLSTKHLTGFLPLVATHSDATVFLVPCPQEVGVHLHERGVEWSSIYRLSLFHKANSDKWCELYMDDEEDISRFVVRYIEPFPENVAAKWHWPHLGLPKGNDPLEWDHG